VVHSFLLEHIVELQSVTWHMVSQ